MKLELDKLVNIVRETVRTHALEKPGELLSGGYVEVPAPLEVIPVLERL